MSVFAFDVDAAGAAVYDADAAAAVVGDAEVAVVIVDDDVGGDDTVAVDVDDDDAVADVDGVTLATDDRILLKDQSTATENGVYTVNASGAPTRATDFDETADVTQGAFIFVAEGTVNADNGFVLTTNDDITLDTTALTFVQFSGAGQIIAGDALSKSGNTLNVNDDNITLEVNTDQLRIKGISATAVGDILLGAATNGGYTRHVKPSSTATTNSYLLSMDTSGNAVWGDVIDGGSF